MTIKPLYGTPASISITTTSLNSSSTLLSGRQSDQVDNSADPVVDALLSGSVTTTGTPTTGTVVEIWVWGSGDGGTTRTAGAGASDASLVLPTVGVKYLMSFAASVTQGDTTARTYNFGPLSVAQLFGGTMPDRWGVFVVHNTGVTLGATSLTYTPVRYQDA